MPKLTRLGSEWNTLTNKEKETQKIAKELLTFVEEKLQRDLNLKDNDLQEKFEKTFPYEETQDN